MFAFTRYNCKTIYKFSWFLSDRARSSRVLYLMPINASLTAINFSNIILLNYLFIYYLNSIFLWCFVCLTLVF